MTERNYGILAAIDWNSKKWQDLPTSEDIARSNFEYVKEKGYTNTALNFGHETYPADEEGYYYGLVPQLWSKTPNENNSKYVEVIFMKFQNYINKQNYIGGFYAFPVFEKTERPSPIKSFARKFELNIKSLTTDIHLLENYVQLNASNIIKFVPPGKEMGHQGFNYLTKANVLSILDAMTRQNPKDLKLSGIKFRLITAIERIK